jgi:hypothetical protein
MRELSRFVLFGFAAFTDESQALHEDHPQTRIRISCAIWQAVKQK